MDDPPPPTVYMPVVSPPTPAPSPGPSTPIFPHIATVSASTSGFAALAPFQRRQILSAILSECTQEDLLFISGTLAQRMRRDFLRDLPPEIAIYVLSFIDDPTSLLRAGRVSRYWNELVADEHLWKRLCGVYRFDVEDECGDDPQPIPAPSDDPLPAIAKHRARYSTGSVPLLADIHPHVPRRTYRKAFKLAYLNLRYWRTGGTLLRRLPLPSSPHHSALPNDALAAQQAAPPIPAAAIPTSVALDADWIVIGLANSRIHIFSARTGVSCRTLVGHTSGVWAVALVKGGGRPVAVPPSSSSSTSTSEPEQDTELGSDRLSSTLRGALGLDTRTFRRRSTPAVFRDAPGPGAVPIPILDAVRPHRLSPLMAPPSLPTLPVSPGPGKPSDPAGTSDGWGQPNALVVSGGCDKDLRVWDVKSGYCIYTLSGHTSTIRCLRVLHSRPLAVTGSRDRTLRVWDIQRGTCLRVLEGHLDSVRTLDVCGNRVVSGSYDRTCRVWDVDSGECVCVLRGHVGQVYSVSFDGVRVASGGMDACVRVWDAESGQCLALLQGHTALVCQVQLSPTMLITGGSDGRVIMFSLDTFSPSPSSPPLPGSRIIPPTSITPAAVQRLPAHDSSVTGLQLDSRFLVTGGNDGRVRLFELTECDAAPPSATPHTSGPYASNGDDHSSTSTSARQYQYQYVRELCEPSESVWKVAYTKETCVVMYKRAGRTFVEIWTFRVGEDD